MLYDQSIFSLVIILFILITFSFEYPLMLVRETLDHYTFLGKLPTYPSPKATITLTFNLEQNVGSGEG